MDCGCVKGFSSIYKNVDHSIQQINVYSTAVVIAVDDLFYIHNRSLKYLVGEALVFSRLRMGQ